MRKVVLLMLMVLAMAFGGYAAGSPLQQAYEKICKQSIGRELPNEALSQIMWELQSKFYLKTAEVRLVGPGLNLQQLQQDWDSLQEIADKIPQHMLKICAFNNFNHFSFYVADESKDGIREVLILWMTGYEGGITIWHCTMTDEMIEQIQCGNVDMGYTGIKVIPMHKHLYHTIMD